MRKNEGADQPAHLRSLISSFVVRCLDSIIPLLAITEISRLQLVFIDEQAGLSFTWLNIPETGFLVRRLPSMEQSNNKDVDQTARMCRLSCIFVFAYEITSFMMTWLLYQATSQREPQSEFKEITVKILQFWTPKQFAVITLKVEQDDFSLE